MLKSSKLCILRAIESSSVNPSPYVYLSSTSSSYSTLYFYFLKFIFGTDGRLKLFCFRSGLSSTFVSSIFSSIFKFVVIGLFARLTALETFLFLRQHTNHNITEIRTNQMRPITITEARWVTMNEFLWCCFYDFGL